MIAIIPFQYYSLSSVSYQLLALFFLAFTSCSLFIYLFVYLSICLFIYLFIYSCLYLFIHSFIYLFIYLFIIYLFIYLIDMCTKKLVSICAKIWGNMFPISGLRGKLT